MTKTQPTTAPGASDIHDVLRDGSALRVVLQPIIDLRLAQVAGYEALTRFGGSPVPPDVWFAAAELAGVGPELEALAMRRALERRAELPAGTFLAVNVSPHLLGSSAVQTVLDQAAPLDGVVVELTEHVDPGERGELLRGLAGVRSRGARIALDDTGTGYSGLREIATLKPDVVKLDRSFVDHCDTDAVKAAVVESLCGIAHRLQATLVAEGVERTEELDWLQQAGVPLAQGWLLGHPHESPRPLAISTVERLRSRADLSTAPNRATAGAVMHWAPGVASSDVFAPARNAVRHRDGVDALVHVVLDAARRPQALVMWASDGPVGDPFPITLRTLTSTSLAQLARQIPARPRRHRYDPVVCTNGDGTYLGVVEVDQILRVLADEVDARPSSSAARPRNTNSA